MDILIAIAVSFTSVFTTELGDKTQLFSLLMGTYFSDRKWLVLLSVFTGMSLVTGIGYGISILFQQFIELKILQIIGGSIFITLGLVSTGKLIYDRWKKKQSCDISEEEEEAESKIEKLQKIKNPFAFVGLLSLFFVLMELGDKSQIMVLCLFLTHTWYGVFIGAMSAFVILNGIGIFVASLVRKWCEDNPLIISIIAIVLSIGLGIWMIVS